MMPSKEKMDFGSLRDLLSGFGCAADLAGMKIRDEEEVEVTTAAEVFEGRKVFILAVEKETP